MSQSDYIQFIRTADILKTNELPAVLSEQAYIDFEKYTLETTIQNTKQSFSRLLPQSTSPFTTVFPNTDPSRANIFDMEKKISTCPTFIMCKNTNTRPNRVLNSAKPPPATFRLNKVYTPNTCYIRHGYVIRSVRCSKKVCKCRTRYITP